MRRAVAAARRPRGDCEPRPAIPAEAGAAPNNNPEQEVEKLLGHQRDAQLRADYFLALRLAHEELAERARAVVCTSALAREGLVVADEALIALVHRQLRAVMADHAALARLPR